MARPSPKKKRIGGMNQEVVAGPFGGAHGDSVGGLPGQKELVISGTGGGAGAGGPKKIKGPGANASIKGKTKGMGGK